MPSQLIDIEVDEVSLVDKAANKRKFLLKKAETPNVEELSMNEEILKAANEVELDNESDVTEAVKKAELSEKGTEAAKFVLQILKAANEDLPKEFYAELVTLAGGELPVKEVEVEKIVEVEKKSDEDKLADLEKKAKSIELSDEDRETLVKSLAEAKVAKELAETIQKDLQKEKDLRKEAEFVQTAEKEFSNLPTEATKLGVILKKASEALGDEDYQEIHRLLKAADEAVASRKDFENVGNSMTTGSGAYEKMVTAAKELISKSDKDMTLSEAITKVAVQNPSLYEEYRQEVN